MKLKASAEKAFKAGLRACDDAERVLTWARGVADAAPEYSARVLELAEAIDHHRALCTVALAGAGES